MSTSVLSSIYDFDLLYREKHQGPDVTRLNDALDKRTVGIPLSNSNKNNKFNAAGYFRAGGLADPLCGAKESASAYMNKENKFRESLERAPPPPPPLLLQDALQPRAAAAQINSTRYKTELCRPFEESGTCKYGEKCQFAHGYHELRNLSRHPKYKTEPCRTFHTIGFCPYGPRCHFIHNVDERRTAPHPPLRRTDSDSSPFPAHRDRDRPRLHHSLSFSGFSSAHSGMLDIPTSRTPPPPSSSSSTTACALAFLQDALSPGPRCLSAFPFPEQELKNFLDPLIPHVHSALSAQVSCSQPPSPPFLPVRGLLLDSPPVSPPLSDHESFSGSCCSSGTISGSESPNLDSNRRLPIFSRLSISDD